MNQLSSRITRICAWLVVGLGAVHIIYGILAVRALTPDLIWFVGAGLAMIFAGQMNLKDLNFVCSLIMLIYFAVTAFILPLPQVFFGLGLFSWLTVASLGKLRVKDRGQSAAAVAADV